VEASVERATTCPSRVAAPALDRPRLLAERVDATLKVEVVHGLDALESRAAALEALAAQSIEPNVFYEPWLLLPALRAYAAGTRLEFVLVFRPEAGAPRRPPALVGFFPLERQRRYKHLPVPSLRLVSHVHNFLCTPLARADVAREVLEAFVHWLATDGGAAAVMEFRDVAGEGPIHQLLVQILHERARPLWVVDWHTRALFRPRQDGEAYASAAISGRHRKELRRKERRLREQGRLEYREMGAGEDAGAWLGQFLELEARGWKGAEGTALACSEHGRTFFLAAAAEAHRRGRLMMLGLFLDGRPLAMKCNFLAGDGAFAFKIAFDEAYAAWSPGMLLEMENIRRLHERPSVRWMDSCADADHGLINRLWLDRRTVQTLAFGTGRAPGDLAIALMSLLRWLQRTVGAPLAHRAPAPLPGHAPGRPA
jgi:CelD/BcsL family acetyltransferase involved in cellulose biosynthesis